MLRFLVYIWIAFLLYLVLFIFGWFYFTHRNMGETEIVSVMCQKNGIQRTFQVLIPIEMSEKKKIRYLESTCKAYKKEGSTPLNSIWETE